MNNNPVGWFEIPVSDLDRAQKFYEAIFGITMKRQDLPGYETVWFPSGDAQKGVSGVLMKGDGYHPGPNGPVMYFTCPDIEAALSKVESVGGKVMLPKKDIGDWGYIGWAYDSEGNIIGLHTRK